jgi:biopolymer transport protein ExbD
MKLRPSRARRRGRIEIIPMIDVMFFLLATFMLASLALQNLHSLAVNLPRGEAAPLQVNSSVTLTITRDGTLLLNETPVTPETLSAVLTDLMPAGDGNVVVNADGAAPNGIVVQAMLRAREAGVSHFLFAIKRE